MIKSTKLNNFQAHKKSILEFSPRINAIIGTSDKGKSSIIRAMRWVVENRPSGIEFISFFSKKGCNVDLEVDEAIISRLRDSTKNSYIVNGETLSAFGQDVPEIVTNILRIGEINIQRQLDKHFLLSDSSGQVAKVLNKAVDLDSIDISISNILTEKRKNENKVLNLIQQIKRLEEQKEGFKFLSGQIKRYKVLELWSKKLAKLRVRFYALDSLIADLISCQEKKGKLWRVKLLPEINELLRQNKVIEEKENYLYNLNGLIKQIKEIDNKLKKKGIITKWVKKYQSIEQMNNRLIELRNKLKNLSNYKKEILKIEEDKTKLQKSKKLLEVKFKKLMPEICPLCGK